MDFFKSSSSSSKKKSRKAWSKSKSPEGSKSKSPEGLRLEGLRLEGLRLDRSKSSSSHKHTSKSKSPKRFEPKSPDNTPPNIRPRFDMSVSNLPKQKLQSKKEYFEQTTSTSTSKSSSSAPQHYGDVKLKMPVLLSDKINYDAAVAKKMDKIFQSYNKLEPFTSSFYLSNLFYLYLFKKYKMECHMPNRNEAFKLHFFLDLSNHSKEVWFDDFVGFQTDAVKSTAKYVSECITSGIKILIIPLTILLTYHLTGLLP